MKYLIAFAVLLLALSVEAANPAFSDFNNTQFGTTGNKVNFKSGAVMTNAVLHGTVTLDGTNYFNWVVITNVMFIQFLSQGTIYTDGLYATNDVSALTFTDRSKAPNLKDAYEIVGSIKEKNGHVDHSVLSPKAWGTRTRLATNTTPRFVRGIRVQETKLGTVTEPDSSKRDLGMVISAQALVIQDLEKRLIALEKK